MRVFHLLQWMRVIMILIDPTVRTMVQWFIYYIQINIKVMDLKLLASDLLLKAMFLNLEMKWPLPLLRLDH